MNWGRLPTTETTFMAPPPYPQCRVSGLQQRVEHLGDRLRADLAGVLPGDPALLVDDDGGRLAVEAVLVGQVVVRVEHDRPRPVVVTDEPHRRGALVVDRDPDHLHLRAEVLAEAGQAGGLLPARRAPAGEEVDDDGLAREPAQVD